ncbi:hypothetical protein [Rhodococcus rhodnii]|uniref:Uncharacterized protein n=1 Tax=Rhodococcus rhodnii LMG 5362 TaxID=1273125 RepID=R7WNK6_9NOCA|nr:hypothetical protein [Rhodococcus rhodnii]EOM76896.1 hypothetical protein Rrhod_1809 [Rhodococcus rhodnii LMG 5362]
MGSADVLQWITDGYLAGDPIATGAFIAVFFVSGVWQLITGGPF